MQKKLLSTYIVIIIVTITFSILFSWNKVNDYFLDRAEKESKIQGKLLVDIMSENKNISNDFHEFVLEYSNKTQSRITLIGSNGIVLADSEKNCKTMENHSYREEVSSALKGIPSTSLRYSDTMKMYYYYYAIPVKIQQFNGVLRVSIPVNEVENIAFVMISTIIFGTIIGSIVAFIIAYIFTKKIMEPIDDLTNVAMKIADGDYNNKIYVRQKDQIGQLAKAFNKMTFNLRLNMWSLEQKNAQLESVLTSMSGGLLAIDSDYKVVLYNDKFTNIIGIEENELASKLFYEITRNVAVIEVVEKSIEQKEYVLEEIKIHKQNEEKIIKISANPIMSKENINNSLGTVIMLEDITVIKKLENMRRDFVSNVTHELKTPLTSIKGFVDTLKNGAIKEDVATRFLDIIEIEVERLANLIQDILSLSEIESIVGDTNTMENSIEKIVLEVLEILKPETSEKNIDINLEIEKELRKFKCNKDRIKQLLINLIDNSIKYTDQGTITIRCKEEFSNLIIEIEDTGIGIDNEHVNRVFERFYRVDKGRSRKMGGTGLGLSIVKHIVELYNGSINIESKVGEGTTIIIKMPY
jgi:two-component system phosphate regulon sensor histidine kinase PhoR